MELQHTFTVPAPVDQAWSTLLDVEGIAPCFPGAALTGVDGDSFAGTVKVKLGPVSLQYAGKGRFLERDEGARRVVLEANGSDKRGNGTAGATVHARLEPLGDDETRVVVDTDLKVTGRPAQFGRGVLQDVGGRIIEQFASCLATRMATPIQTAPTEPAPTDTAPIEPAPASTAPGDASPSGTSPTDTSPSEPAAGEVTSPSGTAPTDAPAASDPTALVAEEPTAATAASARAAGGVAPPASSTTSSSTTSSSTTGPSTSSRLSPAPPAPAAELDLNAVVLPALARRYGPALLAVLLVLIVVRLVVRRRR